MPGETSLARMRRTDAFEAGMSAGSFILIPGECRRLPPAMRIGTRCTIATLGRADHQYILEKLYKLSVINWSSVNLYT